MQALANGIDLTKELGNLPPTSAPRPTWPTRRGALARRFGSSAKSSSASRWKR